MGCTIFLIRHGETLEAPPGARLRGWHDPPLSEKGRHEATQLCAAARRFGGVSALYSSPLQRALDTGACLAGTLGLDLRPEARLREISCGLLDGEPLERVQREHADLWERNLARTDDDFRWPGGESYREFRRRVLETLHGIAAAHPGERIVAVTHAGVITQVLGAINGIPPADWASFVAGYASVTEVSWNERSGSVVRFDDRSHLAAWRDRVS